MPLPIPDHAKNFVDEKIWGKRINPTEEANTSQVNTQILYLQTGYKIYDECDYILFDAITEDFRGWTEEIFNLATTDVNRRFRDFLRINGVYVPMTGGAIAARLAETVNLEEMPNWPDEDLAKQKKKGVMNSRFDETSPKHAEFYQLKAEAPRAGHSRQQSVKDPNDHTHQFGTTPVRTRFASTASTQPLCLPPRLPILPRSSTEFDLKPHESNNHENQPTREIANVGKCYNNNPSIQFGGETYDFLDTKLPIFYDNCTRCALPMNNWNMAFSFMLKGKARQYYYDHLFNKELSFEQLVQRVRDRFHSQENRQMYMREWQSITLRDTIGANPDKTRLECLELTIDKLYLVQFGLSPRQQSEADLRDQLLSACQGIPECSLALYKPADTYEKLCDELRTAIGTAERNVRNSEALMTEPDEMDDQFWTDRTYGRNKEKFKRFSKPRFDRKRSDNGMKHDQTKKCFICKTIGCWSTKHSPEERRRSYERFRKRSVNPTKETFQQFLYEFEGIQLENWDTEEETEQTIDQLMTEFDEEDDSDGTEQFFVTAISNPVNGPNLVSILNDKTTFHQFTKDDPKMSTEDESVFDTNMLRYSSNTFQGILPDSGAANISTAGQEQFQALQKIEKVELNEKDAGLHKIRFGKGCATSVGTTQIRTPIGLVMFHVVPTRTPFLLCLADMDRLGVRLDNLTNELVQGSKKVPIVRKWGHPWLLLHNDEETAASHLTEPELRQLHRRFGHPLVKKLTDLLQRANLEDLVDKSIL